VTAGRDLSLTEGTGAVTFNGTTTANAGRDLSLAVTTGDVSFTGTSTLGAGRNIQLDVVQGDVTLLGQSALTSGQDTRLSIQTGNLGASGTTSVQAGQDVALTVGTGDVAFNNTTSLTAGRNVSMAITTGDATFHQLTTVTAGQDVRLNVDSGDVMFFDDSLFRALRGNLAVTVQAGNIDLTQNSHLDAKVQTLLETQAGEIHLSDAAQVTSDDTVTLHVAAKGNASGGLIMDDADTLIQAGRVVDIETLGDVRIDLIRSGDVVNITTHRGAILDNTAAETDLIFGSTLSMSAFNGIGQPWTNNLNLNVREINAFNSNADGINIQNRTGFKVGVHGIANIGTSGVSDVSVTSTGAIDFTLSNYNGLHDVAGYIGNRPGLLMYVISNMGPQDFEAQFGNKTPQLLSGLITRTSEATVPVTTPVSLIRPDSEIDTSALALQRLVDLDPTVLAVKPVRVVRDLTMTTDAAARSRILETFTTVNDPLANSGSARSVLMKALEAASQPQQSPSTQPGQEAEGRDGARPDSQPVADNSSGTIDRAELRASMRRVLELSDDSLDAPLVSVTTPVATQALAPADDS
jgi:hypothetical protein